MNIQFEVNGTPAEFRWNNITGAADLRVGDETLKLQNPLSLTSQFSSSRERTWQHNIDGHEIEIVKLRPAILPGFRESQFTVKVDGKVVVEVKGT
ncbi:hypothetical protein [Dapis sp. BLCC M126]|uniref:hypothetical protein n=1 Tax=Dapis sp. BLCC M126 TaxID=3400189 RepID=UPI003CE9498C